MKNSRLFVKKRKGFGNKRECLIATKYPIYIPDNIKSIAVVGAGITGLSLAYELNKVGFNITLYDQQGILDGASGNPYALIDPRFLNEQTGDALFNKYAYLYGLDLYSKINCWAVRGLTKYETERLDCNRLQQWAKQQDIDNKHIVNTNNGVELPTSGAVDTKKLATILSAGINFKVQKITSPDELNSDLILFCCGAETNEISDTPYTINRGVIAMTAPIHNKKCAVSKLGYFINADDMTLLGATAKRVKAVEPYSPTRTDKDELIEKVSDIIRINSDQNIAMRHGYRCHTKQRIPQIKQLNNRTFAILGMGARGYINAPYTAHIFKNLLLRNIANLNYKVLKALTT